MTPEQIARVAHEANRALQIEQRDPAIPVSPAWDDTDSETRRSAISGVERVLDSRTRGVSPAADSHWQWMTFKKEHGWKWGPVKDETKKEHPMLVAYDDLSRAAKVKDELFVAIVEALS